MRFPRAIVFDVYGTLLRIAATAKTDAEWIEAFEIRREEFQSQLRQEIARRHETSRQSGIAHPEIQWPEVIAEILPSASPARVARFERITTPAEGALDLLEWLRSRDVSLGLISNAQAYTLDELAECGIVIDWFPVRFFSFEHGFSKPEADAFRWIGDQLSPLAPEEILIVGDRWDNDILPARALGFATWPVTASGLIDLATWLKSLPS